MPLEAVWDHGKRDAHQLGKGNKKRGLKVL